MKIAFVDFVPWDYTIENVYQMPLGGARSALCYLAQALAQQGHEVFLLNQTSVPGVSRGVRCLPLSTVSHKLLKSLDALIIKLIAGKGKALRTIIGENIPLILWTGHDYNQPALQQLYNPTDRDIYNSIVLVSQWQSDRFRQHFNLNQTRIKILGNAVSSSFCDLFPQDIPILNYKSKPPILAYTSTPFRGLKILLEVFPEIRCTIPGTKLKVFSSMKVYENTQAKAESKYNWLYRKCQETEGVEYIGSIAQPQLAQEMKSVTALVYPNTFAETSCIAVMEAMASGCWIITSDLGALSETTAGFARLIPIKEGEAAYKKRFIQETVAVLRKFTVIDTTEAEAHLRAQVNYVNNSYIWSKRAKEWSEWLSGLRPYQSFLQGEYHQAISLYEQAIETFPHLKSNYWYLGLALLLQGEELEAQTTWMIPMLNHNPAQADTLTAELIKVLRTEAQRQEASKDTQNAQLIQSYIQELSN